MTPSSLWKRALILLVCLWGIVAAMPNAFYGRVEVHNDAVAAIELAGGVATPAQEAAKAEWPSFLPSALMNLGLDLRGGAHLLARVEVADVYKARIDSLWPKCAMPCAMSAIRSARCAVRRRPMASCG